MSMSFHVPRCIRVYLQHRGGLPMQRHQAYGSLLARLLDRCPDVFWRAKVRTCPEKVPASSAKMTEE